MPVTVADAVGAGDAFSALHQLPIDEVYHFYLGDPVSLTILSESGELTATTLGADLERGWACQLAVPAGCWQGSRLAPGGRRLESPALNVPAQMS